MPAIRLLVSHLRGMAGLRRVSRPGRPKAKAARLALAAAASLAILLVQADVILYVQADEGRDFRSAPHDRQNPPVQQSQPQKPQPQKQPQLPQFRAEANLVRVDAYVTADGKPVEDLRAEDFEVREDNVAQKVETFEYVRRGQVAAGKPLPGEPERRGRLFVLFVDTYHLPWVDREVMEHRERSVPTWQMEPLRFPLVMPPPIPDDAMFRDALKEVVAKVVGDDDRVAVLTPDMWSASLNFMDRQAAMDELATRNLQPYVTGQRPPDPTHFEACFPDGPNVEAPMRLRYRMWRTFSALEELVANLELVREERKGLLLVTRGWDPPPRILNYRDPREGSLTEDYTVCHTERVVLADRDFDQWYRSIIDEAKRSNVAFYSLYAHPMVTYGKKDADIDEDTSQYQRQWGDSRVSSERMLVNGFPAITYDRNLWYDTLKHLSKDTNGLAILTKDDFEKGLTDIAAGLSSYYLLGYYSTNTKRDSAFRRIAVNVKRKGVVVRARPGYRAVIPAEAEAAALASQPDPVPPVIMSALAPLARLRSDVPFHLAVTPEWDSTARGWRLRIIGEIDQARARDEEWRSGWRTEVTVLASDAKTVAATEVSSKAGELAFAASLPAGASVPPGDYQVRAKAYGSDKETMFDARATVTVPAADASGQAPIGQPVFARRPNMPRSEFRVTADQQFSRREIMRVEFAAGPTAAEPVVRLVDRFGHPLGSALPVAIGDREGTRIATVVIGLSNVAPGDYVLEIAPSDKAADGKVYAAFRVAP